MVKLSHHVLNHSGKYIEICLVLLSESHEMGLKFDDTFDERKLI